MKQITTTKGLGIIGVVLVFCLLGMMALRNSDSALAPAENSGESTEVIEGTISRVATSGEKDVYLDPAGKIKVDEASTPVTDVPDRVFLDGREVVTSSGYVSEEYYFSCHNENWVPGQTLRIEITKSSAENGRQTGCTVL